MDTLFMENVIYGTEERQHIDIAFPPDAAGRVDLVLMIHGGAWSSGDKSCYREEILRFAEKGVVAASMNYRYISDTTDCTDILDDITAALQKVKSVGTDRGTDIRKVLLTGLSAGGHLSLLYAYSRRKEAPILPAAVVSLSGPADLYSEKSVMEFAQHNEMGDSAAIFALFSKCCGMHVTAGNFLSDPVSSALKRISPLYFVTPDTVPTVICHAIHDAIVPYGNAAALDRALTESGVEHTLISYPHSTHVLCGDPDCTAKENAKMREYIEKYLSVFHRKS